MTWRTKLAYGWGSLGNNIVYGFVATYLALFYTDELGITAAAASVLFLVVRVVDALFDPIMGMLVDRTSSRWGRFRPYLLVAPPVLGLLTILIFSVPPGPAALVLAYVTYLFWGLSFTAMDVPYWSMSAALTLDARERTSLVMVPRTLASVGFIGVNLVTLPLVGLMSWRNVAILYAVIAVALTWVTFGKVRERADYVPSPHYGPVEMLRLFRQNGPLQLLLVAMLLTEVAFTIRSIIPAYYLRYNFGAENLVPLFVGVFAITTIAGSLLSPWAAAMWGKRRAALGGIAVTTVTSVGGWITGYDSLTPMLVWIAITGLGYGITNITLLSMLADTVEFGQWKTGRRTEGLVFSTNIFKTKVASAIGASLPLALLAAFGYRAGQTQDLGTLNGLHATMTIVPGLIGVLAALPLVWYHLDERRHAELVRELA
ncbi:GPH family glycoside/pentoside/hexuronide:cation symporter/probable glucitol transport protein GutA [Actinoplanes lutulentus]|uniref:GPH family glycoside/pentoside/hexuronide:cation symporter/probable glucitol transport protein GutA n=1 Tax=Actinoplanes lutulentus TaxID=1287878 RepID=A0A327Z072_9ACTN|nr:glycoside-pentoside-hexuronide (GPH):cation symporter [Actinoplanes lutulentus]MBB2940465.1 GPH family glycoside/pentoside/hexuronide:cation symporter/probable glucitol transport protein GutA [Actinoplanes lutulentus]RAK25803.1 GPH family glycoside/pentoside/hexuronide:cation symporter/probable glucitol transport protein GutA [Actinoplanes lutulentus]